MNCFRWRNESMHFLLRDARTEEETREFHAHAESCPSCDLSNQRSHLLLAQLSSLSLRPGPLAHAGLAPMAPEGGTAGAPTAAPEAGWRARMTRSWRRFPWVVRTTAESTLIVLAVLAALTLAPRVRGWFDRRPDADPEGADLRAAGELSPELPGALHPLQLGRQTGDASGDGTTLPAAAGDHDDFASEGESGAADEAEPPGATPDEPEGGTHQAFDDDAMPKRAGENEVWRFNFRTENPRELRGQIIEVLEQAAAGDQKRQVGGREVPGGIQFELLVEREKVPGLLRSLKVLAPQSEAAQSSSPTGEAFTWYRNRARRPLPPGRARVVIWLSLI